MNSLSVHIRPAGIDTTRRILGIPLRRGLKPGEIRGIEKKITAQSGQGSRGQVFYTISALTQSGRRVILGDGIKGQPVADQLLDLIRDAVPGDPKVTAESGSGISPILERVSQVRKPGSKLRWAGRLIALLIFAFFVYDFARMFGGS